ncbi:MAG: domain S-box, partial [Sediminibacterium sp.]|nr:domain S-box [Sediminibacterium sp.]
MQRVSEKILISTILLAFVGIFIIVFISARKANTVNDTANLISHTNEVLYTSEKVQSLITEDQNGAKGYALTGNKDILGQLYKAEYAIYPLITELKKITSDNRVQQSQIDSLYDLVRRRKEISARVINERNSHGMLAAAKVVDGAEVTNVMRSIRSLISSIQLTESTVLLQRKQHNEDAVSQLNNQFTLLAIATVLIFFTGLVMIGRYIRARKKHNAETEYVAKLVSSVQDAIFSTDAEFIVKSWNMGAEMVYGWTAEEAMGKKIEDLLPTEYGDTSLEKVRSDFTKHGYYNQELIRETRSGNRIHVLVSSSALYDESGKFSGLVAVHKNITERKQLEDQLVLANKALEEKIIVKSSELNNVFERITDAFLALDRDWRYTYMNKKAGEIVNSEPAAMIGKSIWGDFEDVAPAEHAFYLAVHKAMDEQVDVHTEVYYEPYQRWFENHIYPSPEGISIFFRDITDKKIAERNINDSEEKRRLIMNAA